MNDRKLIQQILKQNDQAFALIVDKYKKLVYSAIFRIIRNQSEAEDVFQEVFIELHRSAAHLSNDDDISGWLFRVAYNKSISFLRKKNPAQANKETSEEKENQQNNIRFIDKNNPLEELQAKEAEQVLMGAIDQLPEMQQKVLLMNKFDNQSHKEIADQLNISVASVESLIYRAKIKLRKMLHSYFKKHLN